MIYGLRAVSTSFILNNTSTQKTTIRETIRSTGCASITRIDKIRDPKHLVGDRRDSVMGRKSVKVVEQYVHL
mgnify:CR=1 FL=1